MRGMPNKSLKVVSVKLDAEDRQIVARLQKKHKVTFSEIVRRAIRQLPEAKSA